MIAANDGASNEVSRAICMNEECWKRKDRVDV